MTKARSASARRAALSPAAFEGEASRRASPAFLATMPMGLDGVAADELQEKAADHVLEGRLSTEIRFRHLGPVKDLLRLRSVNDVWLVVREFGGVGPHYRDLRQLGEQLSRTDFSPALSILKEGGHRLKPKMTFLPACSLRGERVYRRQDALQSLEEAAASASGGSLRPTRSSPDLRLWLHIEGEAARLSLALSPKTMGQRQRAASLPASLPGPIAYAMAALTKPRAQQTFVDVTCGSGSIALERAENWRYRLILAGDSDRAAVEATRANFGPRHRPREFLRWNAAALPLGEGSTDAMACNPPHGVQMKPERGLEPLYRGILSEARRVLRPFGLLTFLTPQRALTDEILRDLKGMRIERCFVIDLLGQRPYLYVIRST